MGENEPRSSITIGTGGITVRMDNFFKLIARYLRQRGKVSINILVIGASTAGKSWFVARANGASQSELQRTGLTMGSDARSMVISLNERSPEYIQVKSLDIGGTKDANFLENTLDDNLGEIAILLFMSHAIDDSQEVEESKQFIERFASIVGSSSNEFLRKNIKIIIPIVSKADLWMGDNNETRLYLDRVQKTYRQEYSLLIKILGRERCFPAYLACSAWTGNGIREIFTQVYNKLSRG